MANVTLTVAPWEAFPEAGVSSDVAPWGDEEPTPKLTPEQIQAHMARMRAKPTITGTEFSTPAAEFTAGMSGIPRYLAGLVSPELKEQLYSTRGIDVSSPYHFAGAVADPMAAMLGLKGYQLGGKAVEGTAKWLGAQAPALLSKMGGGAVSGATVGGLTEGQTAGEGAIFGSALAALSGPMGYVWNKLRAHYGDNAAAASVMKYLIELFPTEKERLAAAERLTSTKPLVPGERVTTGTAAVGAEGQPLMPKLKALETAAAGRPWQSDKLTNIEAANELARRNVLDLIAAPGERLPAAFAGKVNPSVAEAIRSTVTEPLYTKARNDMVDVDETLQTILGGPLVKNLESDAAKKFEQLVANATAAGRSVPKAGVPGVPTKYQGVPEWSVAAPYHETAGKPPKISIGLLQDLRQDINKRISTLANSSASADVTELRRLAEANGQLDRWMRGSSQAWVDAQDTFKYLSRPQNQADVAIVLRDALSAPAGHERHTAFLNAIRNAPQTLKKATGDPRYQELSQVLTPTQLHQVQLLEASLRRKAGYERLFAPSSITPAIESGMTKAAKEMPAVLQVSITTLRKMLTKGGEALTERAQKYLDDIVVNYPEKLGDLLKGATAHERMLIAQAMRNSPKLGLFTSQYTAASREDKK